MGLPGSGAGKMSSGSGPAMADVFSSASSWCSASASGRYQNAHIAICACSTSSGDSGSMPT